MSTCTRAPAGAARTMATTASIPTASRFAAGVTTVVDAGSSGWRNFPDFKDRVIDRSQTRVLALLNIVGNGMGGGSVEQNMEDMEAEAHGRVAMKYKDTVVGVKSRALQRTGMDAGRDSAVEAGNDGQHSGDGRFRHASARSGRFRNW